MAFKAWWRASAASREDDSNGACAEAEEAGGEDDTGCRSCCLRPPLEVEDWEAAMEATVKGRRMEGEVERSTERADVLRGGEGFTK